MSTLKEKAEKLYEILHALGKKRSLEVIALTKKAPRSYTELQKELGINSKLVSTKIKELIELDVLRKEWDKYDLSKFGKKLFKKIKPLAKAISYFADDIEKKIEKEVKEIKSKVVEKEKAEKKQVLKKDLTKTSPLKNAKLNSAPKKETKILTKVAPKKANTTTKASIVTKSNSAKVAPKKITKSK